jgi:hypothetical protein
LAATTGAVSFFHLDANGFATWIDVHTGAKYWILARPKKHHDFTKMTLFTGHSYDQGGPNKDCWDLEAVLLLPGTCL